MATSFLGKKGFFWSWCVCVLCRVLTFHELSEATTMLVVVVVLFLVLLQSAF